MKPVMSANDAADLVRLMESAGIDVWLDGGWAVDAVLRQQREGHRREETVATHETVTAAVPSGAARTAAQRERLETHRVSMLDDLGIRDARVRHVRVHPGCSWTVGSSSHTAGNRFVVAEALVAER